MRGKKPSRGPVARSHLDQHVAWREVWVTGEGRRAKWGPRGRRAKWGPGGNEAETDRKGGGGGQVRGEGRGHSQLLGQQWTTKAKVQDALPSCPALQALHCISEIPM